MPKLVIPDLLKALDLNVVGYNIQDVDTALVQHVKSDAQKFDVTLRTFYEGLLFFYKHMPYKFRWLMSSIDIPKDLKKNVVDAVIDDAQIHACARAIITSMPQLIAARTMDMRRPRKAKTDKRLTSLRPRVNKDLLDEVNSESLFKWKRQIQDFHKALIRFYCELPRQYCWIATGCSTSKLKAAHQKQSLSELAMNSLVKSELEIHAKPMAKAMAKTLISY